MASEAEEQQPVPGGQRQVPQATTSETLALKDGLSVRPSPGLCHLPIDECAFGWIDFNNS